MVKKNLKSVYSKNLIFVLIILFSVAVLVIVRTQDVLRTQGTINESKIVLDQFNSDYQDIFKDSSISSVYIKKECSRSSIKFSQGPIYCSITHHASTLLSLEVISKKVDDYIKNKYTQIKKENITSEGDPYIFYYFEDSKGIIECHSGIDINADNTGRRLIRATCTTSKALPDFIPGYTITD